MADSVAAILSFFYTLFYLCVSKNERDVRFEFTKGT